MRKLPRISKSYPLSLLVLPYRMKSGNSRGRHEKHFRQLANCYHCRNHATILLTGRGILFRKGKEDGNIFVPRSDPRRTASLQALTVAEEDGVERGEDRAGVHEPLPPPPLALGHRRPSPRVQLQVLLPAPIKNRVPVPAAIGRRAGTRHRLAPCPQLPGGASSPRIGARFGVHQRPAPPSSPNPMEPEEGGRCRCGAVLAPFSFAPLFCLFLR